MNTARRSQCCLSYWHPRLEGLPSPKTRIVRTPGGCDLVGLLDGERPSGFDAFLTDLSQAALDIGSTPVFLRTGHTSAKHYWTDTCFVDDLDKLDSHVFNLVEFSFLVDLMGLPVEIWAVREFLSIEHNFNAFKSMPIGQEFRFFVDKGDITYVQPYWPPFAIEDYRPSSPTWRDDLASISTMAGTDFEQARDLALQVAERFAGDGEWSVDVCKVVGRGWYVTDMAVGEMSFRWSPEDQTDKGDPGHELLPDHAEAAP